MLALSLLIAIGLAWAAYVVAGRIAGLGVTAFCSATMAYFVMPPVLSFRIAQPRDLAALVFYGGAGLLMARTAPSKRRKKVRPEAIQEPPSPPRKRATLSSALSHVRASGIGARLCVPDEDVANPNYWLPCTPEEASRMLFDILSEIDRLPSVQRVTIQGIEQPSIRRLVVTAHREWPSPLNQVIITGKRHEDCETCAFSQWPSNATATWFDNGYERVFQVSIRT